MLHLAAKVIWGPLKTPDTHDGGHGHPGDIGKREIAILTPLAILVVLLGVAPGFVMNSMSKAVDDMREPVRMATDKAVAPDLVTTAGDTAALDR